MDGRVTIGTTESAPGMIIGGMMMGCGMIGGMKMGGRKGSKGKCLDHPSLRVVSHFGFQQVG